jgi:hypothetical protein
MKFFLHLWKCCPTSLPLTGMFFLLAGCLLNLSPVAHAEKEEPVEQWMSITLGGMPLGSTWLSLKPLAPAGAEYQEGNRYRFEEQMSIPGLKSETVAFLKEDFTLGRFELTFDGADMGQGSFKCKGRMEEGKVVVMVMSEGVSSRKEFEIENKPIFLSNAVHYAVVRQGLEPGWSGEFQAFDPTMQIMGKVTARVEAQEKASALGRDFDTARVVMQFQGIEQTSWITPTGLRIRDEAMNGAAVSVLSSREGAGTEEMAMLGALGLHAFMLDMAEKFQVEQKGKIHHPRQCRRLVLNIGGIEPEQVVQDEYWQRVNPTASAGEAKFQLVIDHQPEHSPQSAESRHLEPDLLVQSDSPGIIKQVKEIVGSSGEDEVKAQKILQWVYGNLDRSKLRLTVPSAAEVLKSRSGDCNEHATLFAALARAAGIPTKIVAGAMYAQGFLGPGTEGFYYHAWNEVFVQGKGWIPVDATLNQMPADATHLKLAEGSIGEQVGLLNVVGKLSVEIVQEEGLPE